MYIGKYMYIPTYLCTCTNVLYNYKCKASPSKEALQYVECGYTGLECPTHVTMTYVHTILNKTQHQ